MSPFTDEILSMLKQYAALHELVENTPDYQLSVPGQMSLPFEQTEALIRQIHAAMGLNGEAGEVLDLFKKQLFGKHAGVDQERLKDELGDIFWYFFLMLKASDLTLDEVMGANIIKLSGRYQVEAS